jgi:hypothetical protein
VSVSNLSIINELTAIYTLPGYRKIIVKVINLFSLIEPATLMFRFILVFVDRVFDVHKIHRIFQKDKVNRTKDTRDFRNPKKEKNERL